MTSQAHVVVDGKVEERLQEIWPCALATSTAISELTVPRFFWTIGCNELMALV